MPLAESTSKRRGRPSIDEIPLHPHIQRAFIARANGTNWIEAAAEVKEIVCSWEEQQQ